MAETLKEKTAKGLFWGGLGNGIQQLLSAVIGIFLGRILCPDDYGMVGMLTIFSLIANTIQESGFTNALANRKSIEHRDYNAVFWFSTLMGLCLYIVLFICAPLIAWFFHQDELIPLSRYVFLGFVISSTITAHNAMLFKKLMVKQKAIAQTLGLLISGCIGIVMAYNGWSYWGIASQNIIYISVVALCIWYFSPWRPTFELDFTPIKEMFGFSCKIMVTNMCHHFNSNILSIILGRWFTVIDVGNYTQANKWNSMIACSGVGNMILGIAQPVLNSVDNEKERMRRVFRKMLRFTAFVSFPALFGLGFIAHEFITITITDKWIVATDIMQILCVWGAFYPITALYSHLVISHGLSNVYMYNNIALGICQAVVLICIHSLGVYAMMFAFVSIYILWLLIWQYWAWKIMRLKFLYALKDIVPFIGIALGAIFITHYATFSIENIYVRLIMKIIMVAAIYSLAMKLTKAKIFHESINYIFNKNKIGKNE